MNLRNRLPLAGLVLLLTATAACDSDGPTASVPTPEPAVQLAKLDCTVTVAQGAMACQGATPSTGGANGLIVGGQGAYVFLQASNHAQDLVAGTFSIDVTVQNLMRQALGTTDGTTLDPQGVMVLFDQEPFPAGGDMGAPVGLVGEGRALLMRANQAYYPYNQIIQPNETSAPVTWNFTLPAAVTSFKFVVYVMAAVEHPQGYVELTPAADTLAQDSTTALTAVVRTAYGDTVPGQTITWGTSDAAIATVSASGLVTGVAPGLATITATAGSRTGSTTIAVCPNLDVGEVYTATMPAASSLCFTGGAAGQAEYTYMPVNLSNSAALSLTLTGSGITAVSGPPSPNLLPAGNGPRLDASLAGLEANDAFHTQMLARDRDLAMEVGRKSGARITRPRTRGTAGGPSRVITPNLPTVGDLWNLNTAQGCSGTVDNRVGRVVSIGTNIILVADTSNPAGGFNTAQWDSIRMEFDTLVYGVNTDNFGAPTDLDTNGRVVAFYTRAVNELSPPASSVVTLGYVTARDLFSSAANSCPRSNEGEIFYMLVPDPTGAVNSNVRTVSYVRGNTVGTLAHEFQHLINASRRIYLNGTWSEDLEEVWLNEGLSHIAEELMFYRTSVGLAPRGNILLASLTTGPSASRRVAAFNTYANSNFGRLRSWLQRPDTAGAFKNNDALAVRGAIWAFLRYSADRLNATDATLWYNLVNTQTTGQANLQAAMGVDPQVWLRDFTSAMYADDAVTGIGAAQQVTSWSFRSVFGGLGGFPLGTRTLSNGTGLTLAYSRGGGSAYARFGVPMGGFASVTALSGGVAPTSPYSMIVIRTK
ncbi:Ig-like domain-containing protein [Longimicrobium sp.]|uniref:Ig-like domain-containing protein n=1 Tax=Longimicrobium sp. TaxID=2029185 RepID=UPI002E360378|nr:Ig-like domain-containing protein [Longimicrobium sp.]HEX6038074.1 Ig-like domain-containing protein [Longimicrobium sp.]